MNKNSFPPWVETMGKFFLPAKVENLNSDELEYKINFLLMN